jgi:hypothetical protein
MNYIVLCFEQALLLLLLLLLLLFLVVSCCCRDADKNKNHKTKQTSPSITQAHEPQLIFFRTHRHGTI